MPYSYGYSPYFYWDWTLLILLPGLLLGLIAQASVQSAFRRYSRMFSRSGLTGAEAARRILAQNGIYDVQVTRVSGNLTDYYDPRNRVLRLSDNVYDSTSLAALGVAAHECGHACQHNTSYVPLTIRNAMAPVVSFGSNAVFPILLLGIFVSSQTLLNIAILLYLFVVLFQLVTLPVEFNASHRALVTLEEGAYLASDEVPCARKVLRAAALTYVAAALSSMLQLLRLFLLYGNRNRRD